MSSTGVVQADVPVLGQEHCGLRWVARAREAVEAGDQVGEVAERPHVRLAAALALASKAFRT